MGLIFARQNGLQTQMKNPPIHGRWYFSPVRHLGARHNHKDDTDLIFEPTRPFVPTMTNHLRSVRIDYDGLGVVQDRLLFRPTGMDDGIDFDFGLSVEMFCKQMGTGLKLMVSEAWLLAP